MSVLVELGGVLCVAATVRYVHPGARSLLPALAIVALVLGGFAFWRSAWTEGRGLIDQHSRDARLTREQALALPGTAYGAREDVLAWADVHLPRRARVFLECPQPTPCPNALANWITYRLQPRVFTDRPGQARWVLFYGTSTSALSGTRVMGLIEYASGFAIGRLAG